MALCHPEFLVEGKAIEGSIRPDRVVVGAWNERTLELSSNLSAFSNSQQSNILKLIQKEAAAGKLLANFYLFNKLAVCFDVIGRACETFSHLGFEISEKF